MTQIPKAKLNSLKRETRETPADLRRDLTFPSGMWYNMGRLDTSRGGDIMRMADTRSLREYALELLKQSNDVVRLFKRTRERLEKLPNAEWWDLSHARDGSERLEIRVGRRYYYIYYWTRYFINGWSPDRCVRIRRDSAEGKRIACLLAEV